MGKLASERATAFPFSASVRSSRSIFSMSRNSIAVALFTSCIWRFNSVQANQGTDHDSSFFNNKLIAFSLDLTIICYSFPWVLMISPRPLKSSSPKFIHILNGRTTNLQHIEKKRIQFKVKSYFKIGQECNKLLTR